jgi:membrane protease YdiL (CAAX protease family)
MEDVNPAQLIVFALTFITVFYWVQTFQAYWNSFFVRERNGDDPLPLLGFTLFLTVVTVFVLLLYKSYYSKGKAGNTKGFRGLADPPDEVFVMDEGIVPIVPV